MGVGFRISLSASQSFCKLDSNFTLTRNRAWLFSRTYMTGQNNCTTGDFYRTRYSLA